MAISFPFPVPDSSPFGVHNIPFGIYSTPQTTPRAATAVGNYVLDLDTLLQHGVLTDPKLTRPLDGVFLKPYLNEFAALPISDRRTVREIIIRHLTTADSPLFKVGTLQQRAFIPIEKVTMHLPMRLTDYTDFYSSLVHADKAGKAMNIPIPAAFYEYPMAYNGRVSSIAVSGTDVIRPKGFFLRNPSDKHVGYQPSQALDFEVEMGCFISLPVAPGDVVNAKDAWKHVFGYVLLNDWSARDVQKYEMHPFGPLHSKSFLTSISPWVVTPDALKGSIARPVESNYSPELSSHLRNDPDNHAGYDIDFSVSLSRKKSEPVQIVRTNLTDAYWDSLQMIAYQSSSGCSLNTGDLLGSGTTSSPTPRSEDANTPSGCGCLFESNACGEPLPLVAGEKVVWLEDGDLLTIEGWFTTPDGKKAGFGPLSGLVQPAREAAD
ncbi:2-hydroxyhepta-2,4-diene-1,7-dioate isomerase [Talaromyces pinophilus]|uniref:Fumarylacetoacetase n=1 Tax=Talaromyces pinophilus TaxID=128442 RepID=A0A478ECS5_TALPI|nr:2-hydroxyhepta-2,4-diene-1,7-dioate isomerase [Talaromyces pinophilus]